MESYIDLVVNEHRSGNTAASTGESASVVVVLKNVGHVVSISDVINVVLSPLCDEEEDSMV